MKVLANALVSFIDRCFSGLKTMTAQSGDRLSVLRGPLIVSSQVPFPANFQLELCLMEGPRGIGKSSRLSVRRVPHMCSPSSWPREPNMPTKWC